VDAPDQPQRSRGAGRRRPDAVLLAPGADPAAHRPRRGRARQARRARRPRRQGAHGGVQPAPRRLPRQEVPGQRHDPPRAHPGGLLRPRARGREVRPPQGLQVLDLRELVDPAVDPAGHPPARGADPDAPARARPGAWDRSGDAPAGRRARPAADGRGARGGRGADLRAGRAAAPRDPSRAVALGAAGRRRGRRARRRPARRRARDAVRAGRVGPAPDPDRRPARRPGAAGADGARAPLRPARRRSAHAPPGCAGARPGDGAGDGHRARGARGPGRHARRALPRRSGL
ncbi:MAG: RNA polymerase sigma factor RpoD, partial [uncultured Solirubrobacteraceae bacterium]